MIKDNTVIFGEGDIVTLVGKCDELVYFNFVEITPPQKVGEIVTIEKATNKNNNKLIIALRKEDVYETINSLGKAINKENGIVINFNYIGASFTLDFSSCNKESMLIVKKGFEYGLSLF